MPCYGGPSEPEISITKSQHEDFLFQKALLCAAFSFLSESHNLDEFFAYETNKYLDWDEIGITPEHAEKWWAAHLREDELRRKKERLEKEKKEAREKALKKLTKEERKILGLK